MNYSHHALITTGRESEKKRLTKDVESVTKENDVTREERRRGGKTNRDEERKVFSCFVTPEFKRATGLWLISNRLNKNIIIVDGSASP